MFQRVIWTPVETPENRRGANREVEDYFRTFSFRLMGQGRLRMLAMISFWNWMFWNSSSGSLLSTRSSLSSSSEELQEETNQKWS